MTTAVNPSPPKDKLSRKSVIAASVSVALLIIFIVLSLLSLRRGPKQEFGGCRPPVGPIGSAGAQPGLGQVTAKLREGQINQVDFGRDVNPKSLVVYVDLSGDLSGPARLHTQPETFRRNDDARLSSDPLVTDATVVAQTVKLTLCLGRADDGLGDPGSYKGSITLDDSRLANTVTVPVTVTMQYVHGVLLWWIIAAVILPGSWVLWVQHTHRDPVQSAFAVKEFGRWAFSVEGVASIVSGVIAASTVYIAVYIRDPTWGSSALQPVTLFGGMFSAFVTAAGLTQIARGKPGQGEHAPE